MKQNQLVMYVIAIILLYSLFDAYRYTCKEVEGKMLLAIETLIDSHPEPLSLKSDVGSGVIQSEGKLLLYI